MSASLRVLFLFTNTKKGLMAKVRTGQDVDTSLHGFNHIPNAKYLVASPTSIWTLRFVPRLLRYDCIIAQDNFMLGYTVSLCSRIFRSKTKWFYIAIHSSTLMRRHTVHPIRLYILKKFWSSYARIICLSSEQLEDFVRFGIPRERLVFVPFGIDARFFESVDTVREEGLIVSVGRDAGRDYATLFKAAERLEHPFVVVASRKNIPSDVPIPTTVEVRYDRDLAEVRDLYAHARLVVVVSKSVSAPDGSDCSGQTVIMDALAAGKAVVATNRPWIEDYFVAGKNLIIVPPNDPSACARAIEALWHDGEKRKRLAMSGRETVIRRYTTKIFAESLIRIMRSV